MARTTQIFGDVFAVTLIGFTLSLSLAYVFAEKGEYEIRPSQVRRYQGDITTVYVNFVKTELLVFVVVKIDCFKLHIIVSERRPSRYK